MASESAERRGGMVRRIGGRVALVAFGVVAGLVLLEVVLQVGALIVRANTSPAGTSWLTGHRRVVTLGDSNTYGVYLDNRDLAYPKRFEQLWNASSGVDPIEVVNLGYPGTNSSQARIVLRHAIETLHPDVVTVMVGVNDWWTETRPVEELERTARATTWLWQHSRVYRLLYMIRRAGQAPSVEFTDHWGGRLKGGAMMRIDGAELPLTYKPGHGGGDFLGTLVPNLKGMVDDARQAGVELVVLTYVPSYGLYGAASRFIRQVTADTGARLVDVGTALLAECPKGSCPLVYPDGHLNDAGHERTARVLVDTLRASPPVPDRASAGADLPGGRPGAPASVAQPLRTMAGRNVVVLVVDALRADHMGFLGDPRRLTPFLDSLAARSVVFHRAYAAAPHTVASVASLLTSRLPAGHGALWFASTLPEAEVTLPEVLHEHGYATGVFSGSVLFKGFDQGCDARAIVTEPDGAGGHVPRTNSPAMAWWKRLPVHDGRHQPAFVYLHYMDVRAPYNPVGFAAGRLVAVNQRALARSYDPRNDVEVRDLRDVYAASVANIDRELRDFLTSYGPRDLLDDAVLVVTGDHGEDLGEHDIVGHGRTLYETALHVPLLIHLPGQTERVDVDEVVSLLDVAPTLLDVVGVSSPSSFTGRALAPAGERPAQASTLVDTLRRRWDDPVGADSEDLLIGVDGGSPMALHRRAVVRGWHKLIVGADGAHAYYDLQSDPGELHPDALTHPERAVLERALARMEADGTRNARPRKWGIVDATTRTQLRALGYGTE